MLFIIITVLALAGVVIRQSSLRFMAASSIEGKFFSSGSRPGYGAWLLARTKAAFTAEAARKTWKILSEWCSSRYPGWFKWIFIGFGSSLIYLAASGLFFAIFIPRGMFGFPLLGHMAFGGVFALSLAAVLIWRGRAYRLDSDESAAAEGFAFPVFKNLSKSLLRKWLFWMMAAFGFILVATALGSMLPVFTFETQRSLIEIHRYVALALVLTTIVFVDITFIPAQRA